MLRVHSVSALMVRSVSSGIAPAAVLPRRRWRRGGPRRCFRRWAKISSPKDERSFRHPIVKLDSSIGAAGQHPACLFHPTAHRTVLIGFLGQWGWRRHTAGTGPAVRHGRYPEPAPPRPVHAAGVADVSAHPRGAHRPQRERRKVAGSSLLKRCCRTSASLSRCLLAGA